MNEKKVLITFGKNLKHIRKNQHKSQEQLATEAHLHRTYIGMMERGIKNPTLFTLYKLSNALDIPINKFLNHITR